MKLKFIFDSKKESLNSIDNIYLSSQNPRYTTLKSMKDNLLDKIKDSLDKSQENIKNTLLKYEGDFSDLRNLMESILDIGFDSVSEPILLVKNNNKYFVAEGNRRIMCLKFLLNKLEFNKEINTIENVETNDNIINDSEDTHVNYLKRREGNHKKILKYIYEIRKKYCDSEWEIHLKIIEKDEELWKMIYTKHIVGERPGMRKWNRGKYFTDILSFFEKGIKKGDKVCKKIRIFLQREPNIIIEDFKQAQFVREILKRAKIYSVSKNEVTDKMIFNILKKIKVSALQSNFSLKRVKDSAKEYLNIDNKTFENKYFKHEYDDNHLLIFSTKNKIDEILEFIYDNFSKNIITTRPIKLEDKNEFNIGIKKILNGTWIDTKKKQNANTLMKINSFDYKIKQLGEIIFNAEQSSIDNSIIKRFKITKIIKENNEKIEKVSNKFFKFTGPSEVFKRLHKQYMHNYENNCFINAMASTIRSMLEQILIWGAYFNDDIVSQIIPGNDNIETKKYKYISELSKNKIYKLFHQIKENHFNEINIHTIVNSIVRKDKNVESKFISSKEKEINEVLNEFIHASHRIYNSRTFNNDLEKFSQWQKHIISIIEDIDESKIKKLSEEIKTQI